MQKEKVVIIGSGPAGLTAALYAGRDQIEPVLIAGMQLGGQVSLTHEIENYPGFPEGLGGPDLTQLMLQQAERFGTRTVYDEVIEVDFKNGSPFTVKTHGETYSADSVIVTAGASPRLLGIPGEQKFTGRGVSYCGTCDGFFFRDQDVIVVGGGDSALEEGIFLTRFAKSVTVVVRRDELRANPNLQTRARANEKISFVWNTIVDEVLGEEGGKVNGVRVTNRETGEQSVMPTEGVFVFIGHYPNSTFLVGQLEMDEQGYVITDEKMRTSVDGVFAGGEIQDTIYKQVATSVGQGCAAAMMAEKWLAEKADEGIAEPA